MNSIFVDWSKENIWEEWDFKGQSLIREKEEKRLEKCEHKDKESEYHCSECECYPEDRANECFPMMNYAYPIDRNEIEDEKIIEVSERTNCTVIYNTNDDEYYLALTGGGMNLSQDIALAYLIATGWIPDHILSDICIQPCLSVNEKDWLLIAKGVIRGIENRTGYLQRKKKEWKEARKKFNADRKAKKK